MDGKCRNYKITWESWKRLYLKKKKKTLEFKDEQMLGREWHRSLDREIKDTRHIQEMLSHLRDWHIVRSALLGRIDLGQIP